MKSPVAPVTQGIPTALAAASIGLSLFLLPGGGGSLRPLPVVPAGDLIAGRITAPLENQARASVVYAQVGQPALAGFATPGLSSRASSGGHAAPPATRHTGRRRAVPGRVLVPPHPSPPVAPPTPPAPPAPPAPPPPPATVPPAPPPPPAPPAPDRGKGKAGGKAGAHGHSPPPDNAQGPPAPPPSPDTGGGGDHGDHGDHGNHGGEKHGGGGR